MTVSNENGNPFESNPYTLDAVIVGAGFAGLYMLQRLRELGYSAKVFDDAEGIGGTWYWNCYPGARCDIESYEYSYSFSDELQHEWQWSEKFAAQPEILRYINHVADKFDLRKDIQLKTRVIAAIFDDIASKWIITTDRGDRISAKFCIMATGTLSAPKKPDIKDLGCFKGNIYSTSRWPHEDVSFYNRCVAIIGTGASGIQCIPAIAKQAKHLYVFQRTPNFCFPINNKPTEVEYERWWKSNYAQHRCAMLKTFSGVLSLEPRNCSALSVTPEERQLTYESTWNKGGNAFCELYTDIYTNKEANDTISSFIRAKIHEIVKDPIVADSLSPYDHYFGTKRVCSDNHYLETFNDEHVTLVDLRNTMIEAVVPTGLRVNGKIYEVDDIVLAIGFDGFTGALLNIDVQGKSGKTLKEKWSKAPRAYLGLMISGFPNLFTITGPGSPAELSNMVPHIEENVRWIAKAMKYLQSHQFGRIEATIEAEDAWVKHVQEVADSTLFPTANSWYNGANIDGKPKTFVPYIGGLASYLDKCEQVAANGYEGFTLSK